MYIVSQLEEARYNLDLVTGVSSLWRLYPELEPWRIISDGVSPNLKGKIQNAVPRLCHAAQALEAYQWFENEEEIEVK